MRAVDGAHKLDRLKLKIPCDARAKARDPPRADSAMPLLAPSAMLRTHSRGPVYAAARANLTFVTVRATSRVHIVHVLNISVEVV